MGSIGGQRATGRLVGLEVVPDRGSQGQHALSDADSDAFRGPPVVLFQVEPPLRVSLTDSISFGGRPGSRAVPAKSTSIFT
jgi:hypothetical protein